MSLRQGSRGFLSAVILHAWSSGLTWAAITQRIIESRLVKIKGDKNLTDVCNCTALWWGRTITLLLTSGTLTLLIRFGVSTLLLLLLAWPSCFIRLRAAIGASKMPSCTMRVASSSSRPASFLPIVSQISLHACSAWGLISPANSPNGNFSHPFILEVPSGSVSFQQWNKLFSTV